MPFPPHAFSPFLNYYDPSDSFVDIWRGTGLTGDAYFASRNDSIPLIVAAQSGNLPLVQQLISQGPPVDQKGLEGETALHMASALGHLSIVRALISAGALVDALDVEGSTPLIHAIRFCPPDVAGEIATTLLSAGANPVAMVTVDISRHPPLWFAIRAHKLALVRLLEPLTPQELDVYPPGSVTSRNYVIDAAIMDADSSGDTSILEFLIRERSLPLRATDPTKASQDQTLSVLLDHLLRNKDSDSEEAGIMAVDILSSLNAKRRPVALRHLLTQSHLDLNRGSLRSFILSSGSPELVVAARELGLVTDSSQ